MTKLLKQSCKHKFILVSYETNCLPEEGHSHS